MRTMPFLWTALVAGLLLPAAVAQMPAFDEAYQVRGALGDIPGTSTTETPGAWNLEQRLRVVFDNTTDELSRTYHFGIPTGAALANASCDCYQYHTTVTAVSVTLVIDPATTSGERVITIVTRQVAGGAFGFTLRAALEAPADRAVVLYVPAGSQVASNLDFASPGSSTDGAAAIQFARFTASDAMPAEAWFTLHPLVEAPAPVASGGNDDLVWVFLALGIGAGALLWSRLVAAGVVQKRSRKQVAGTAAHVEAAATDSAPVLEGKKRALLAALKEVELAKQANEMPLDVYDAVKADLKKQAVTVMRALEPGPGGPKA